MPNANGDRAAMAKFPASLFTLAASLWLAVPGASAAASSSLADDALAILEKNCLACHGSARMAGLDLRQRETLLKGGGRGPAAAPGNAAESLLYQVAAHVGELVMPPGSEEPLPAADLEILAKWINQGAPWPASAAEGNAEPEWWAFRKPRRPAVPTPAKYANLVQNPIDSFVLSKIEEKNLALAPAASKVTLVRRAYFDLIGLPPTPEQIDEFLNDSSPKAYEKLIDKLLASDHYGERWARHWLDVVRYADSEGFESDLYVPNAWRYRDYVIKSFNEDKPYDRFVQEQIAGDELWPDNLDLFDSNYAVPPEKLEHLEARVGTSMYAFGPVIPESNLDTPRLLYERLTDWVDTTGAAFMGLSLGCARCHDHKFDPFSQRDYYSMQAIFATSQPVTIPVVTEMSAVHRRDDFPRYIALDEVRDAYGLFEDRVKKRITDKKREEFSPEVVAAYDVPEDERSEEQQELVAPLKKAIEALLDFDPGERTRPDLRPHMTPAEKDEYETLVHRMAEAVISFPTLDPSHKVEYDTFFDVPSATVLGHVEPELIQAVHVRDRGDVRQLKEKVGPAIPRVFGDGVNFEPKERYGPRYRKEFALWLTNPHHPLTARVMVNRLWQWHFGAGIVSTANDFGRQGRPPTHPALLDWLAREFVRGGWSLKSAHRLIMGSSTYQRSSEFQHEGNTRKDPTNSYLWRMNRRRLEAEAVWDNIHSVAGTLNTKMWGRPVLPPMSQTEMSPLRRKWSWTVNADPKDHTRRAIYILRRRNFDFPMFEKFDTPNSAVACERRDVTTVAPQSLWLLNNEMSFQQALHFADRLVKDHGDDAQAWVENAWRTAVGRPPTSEEKQDDLDMLEAAWAQGAWKEPPGELPEALRTIDAPRAAALTELCLAVFNLNEFLFVD